MKYTKDQLRGMNSAQVNIALADSLGFKLCQHNMTHIGKMWVIEDTDGGLSRIPDYCNCPSDIMPIAFEHKICLITDDDGWIAFLFELQEDDEMEYADKNPLRAIACCLILVLQEKKNDNC